MIGFIGLGNMGGHMARNLIKNGKKLIVFDVMPAPLEQLKSAGASVAASPADVAAASKQIITMLPSSPHVLEVYNGSKGIFQSIQPGTTCLDSSTIDPSVSVQVSELAVKKKALYLDAPVSGGVLAAQNALLTFMVGGDAKAFAECEPILQLMGKNIVHCGKVGTGQAAKVCNNMLLAICMIGTSEALNLGQKLGLDPVLLSKIINTSSGRNWSSELYNPVPGVLPNVPASKNYDGGFAAALMAKDLGLAQNAATASSTPTPLGSLSHQIYRILGQLPDYQKKDFSVVYKFLCDQLKK
jgi:3-hydroxyisobutyrate dehydrogenase